MRSSVNRKILRTVERGGSDTRPLWQIHTDLMTDSQKDLKNTLLCVILVKDSWNRVAKCTKNAEDRLKCEGLER